jgi:hypothetical protein
MLFIFSSPRSGSTLLAQTLSAHSQIIIPHESDYIVPAALLYTRISDPAIARRLVADMLVATHRFPKSVGEYVGAEQAREAILAAPASLSGSLNAVYRLLAEASGKRVGGDKSPNDLIWHALLNQAGVFSDEQNRVIHLVRDVRDAFTSLKRQEWMPGNTPPDFPLSWARTNRQLHAALAAGERYLLVRYEDMVARPEATVARLCGFLGVAFEDAMLDPANRHGRYRSEGHHQRLYDPISTAYIGEWQRFGDVDEMRFCEQQAGATMQLFGYEPATDEQLAAVRQRAQRGGV